jgi:TRAP-type C4-dicarboxylate transport system substrate-binding protein
MRRTTADSRARAALLAAMIPLVVAGCGSSAADKAGGARTAKPKVLTLANGNGDARALEPFAAAVARLSGGTLRIAIKSRWRYGAPGFETGVIRDVRAGKADLGWAATRAFDDVGVGSFDALHAPLLIDSYPLERKALDGPLVPEMLGGLRKLGLAGLGILPGPLRKPLGISRLVRPQDYVGATLAFQRSQVAEQALHALGARGAAIPASGAIDSYDGVEQQIESIAGNQYDKVGSYLTANVNLWPRPVVLFANAKALVGLDGRQRAALRGAARASQAATLALLQADDREATAVLCRRGVQFVTARAADLAALRRAVQPVYDELERRAQTKAAIERIRALRADLRSSPDAPRCSGTAAEPGAPAVATPIDGVYRSDVTLEQLRRTRGYDSGENHRGNAGHFKLELRGGRFRVSGSSDGVDEEGTYSLKGGILRFAWNQEGSYAYRASLYRGALTLRKTGEGPTMFAVHPWRRQRGAASVGAPTPLDGVYVMTSTREEAVKASGEPNIDSENYGRYRFVMSRGRLRYTQSSEGASRWTTATYTVKGRIFTFTVTDFGGEAPNGAAEKTGEVYTFRWSRYRDRLTLAPVAGKISPENFRIHPWRRVGDAP